MGKQYVDTNTKSFTADGAYPQYALAEATANPGEVTAGTASGPILGSMCETTFAAGDRVSLKLLSGAGTVPVIASGAIARGADVFAAAGGKVAAAGTVKVGVALDAAAADNDIIEIMPTPS